MDEKDSYNDMRVWKNSTPEEQEKNFKTFISLLEEFKEDDYYLFTLFSSSDKNVLKNHNDELAELISKNQKNLSLVKNVWKSLDLEYQKEYKQILSDTIDQLVAEDEDISQIWKATNGEVQTDMLENLFNKYDDKETIMQIFRGLNVPLSKNDLKSFLEKNEVLVDDIDSVYEIYQSMFKMNKNLNNTIDFEMFDSKILNMFNLEQMTKLTTYPELQSKIISLSDINGFDAIVKSINDKNWVMELDGILKNVDNYSELFENISKEEIDEDSASMLVQVLSQKENYFNISNVSEAKKYFEIRKDICQRILNDEEIENLNSTINGYSEEDKKRFAILELMYGVDIDDARNLIEKYGKDIDKIDIKKYGKNAIALIGMKRILECENIGELYNANKSVIDKELQEIDYSNVSELEMGCINMYEQMYEETLYHPQEEDKIDVVQYEGTEIDVYEIEGDFNMFVRAEGACNGYEEPENFASKLATPSTKHHGNCKSFIGQDSISIANSEGVKYGYSKCANGSLLMSAPWDIMSNGANSEFSTASEKWNLNCGIQFRTPQEMINNTRHGYNEFDFEKLKFDEKSQSFDGDIPQYIVYVQEVGVDRENDDKWRVSQKAAGQMNLPIVIINREKFVKKEWEKVEELQNIFLGNSENKDNIPETELLEQIILKFENNANTVRGSDILSKQYFSFEQRNTMVKNLVGRIKSFENEDFSKYQELFNKFRDVVQSEEDKTKSNTDYKVADSRYGESFLGALKRKCSEIEVESSKRALKDAYQNVGIEETDLHEAKQFLENEKTKGQEQEVQIERII